MASYRANFKSMEERGAGQPNSIEFGAADDATATTIATSLAALVAGDYMSLTKIADQNYVRPYPAGTSLTATVKARDASGHLFTQEVYNVKTGTSDTAMAAALLATGFTLPNGGVATSIQVEIVDVSLITPV